MTVIRRNELYELDFPAYDLKPVTITEEMLEAIGAKPEEAYLGERFAVRLL